jgi:hypothetical protein
MAVDEKELRSFLVKIPRPAKVLVRTEDDDLHELQPPTGKGSSWANVAHSIAALEPALVECHDAEGKLLRATRCTESALQTTRPETLPVLHTDPETARLTHFANLLHRSYEFSTGLAFTKMVELYTLNNERMMAVEARLERSEANFRREMQQRLDEAFDRAEELAEDAQQKAGGDPVTEFVKGLSQGAAEKQATPANGAKS